MDEFILWVDGDEPYQTAQEYLDAAKAAGPGGFKMGGTGSKQEDQIITVALQEASGAEFTYMPFKGGGDVAVQLVGGHVNSTVNNPIEQVAHWRAGDLRPLCVFDSERLAYTDKMTDTMAWSDIPTCKEAGIDVEYLMLRGIFMPAGVEQEHVDFYVDLFSKVRETPEWQDFMSKGAFNATFMTGDEYKAGWREAAELHQRPDGGSGLPRAVSGVRLRDRPSPVPEPSLAGANGRRAWTRASYRLAVRGRDMRDTGEPTEARGGVTYRTMDLVVAADPHGGRRGR